MTILLNNNGLENHPWAEVFANELPDLPVVQCPDVPDRNNIKYAAVWAHPHNDLQRYPNLRAVFLLGAGTDHIDNDPAVSKLDIPIVRLIDPDVGTDMAQYTLYWTMHFHRGYERYRQQAELKVWQRHQMPRAVHWRVTILGLGRIGEFVARLIAQSGFAAQAWNRSMREVDNVRVLAGYDKWLEALAKSDVIVNCLPLNPETKGLLNAQALNALPNEAYLINISRGAVVDETALIEALENGQLAGAALDCFHQEPLSKNSPLWHMDNVYITPHIAGATYARSAAKVVADNIKRMELGDWISIDRQMK